MVLFLGMFVYNILRLIGQLGLGGWNMSIALYSTPRGAGTAPRGRGVVRRRLRTVMQDLIYLACRLVRHARGLRLVFGKHCPWFLVWRHVYLKLVPT
jgi:hypothetical protein